MIKRLFLLFSTCFLFTLFAADKQLLPFNEYLRNQNYETWLPSYIFSYNIHLYQRTLLILGYNPGPIDGLLGPKTKKAIREFQRDNNLIPDGIIGPKTENALYSYIKISDILESISYISGQHYQHRSLAPYLFKKSSGSQNYTIDYKNRLVPFVAENRSHYGQISKNTGRPKTVYVRGYYRKDGTYVRSHYRSRPRR